LLVLGLSPTMVVLDLLDFDSTAAPPPYAGTTSSYKRGDVVLAKYGKTNSFYWAKVKKVQRKNNGASLCDVEWLRPQAGAAVGKLFVLHDGYDETQCGEGLDLSRDVRRASSNDVATGAPPGVVAAVASSSAGAAGKDYCKGAGIPDLLGEPIVEKRAEPEWSSFQSEQAAFHSAAPGAVQNPTQGWHNLSTNSNFASWPGMGMQASAGVSQYHSAPAAAARTQPRPMQQMHSMGCSSMKPVAASTSINELQASLVSDLQLTSSAAKGPCLPSSRQGSALHVKAADGQQEPCFDFISDMMSGALNGAKIK